MERAPRQFFFSLSWVRVGREPGLSVLDPLLHLEGGVNYCLRLEEYHAHTSKRKIQPFIARSVLIFPGTTIRQPLMTHLTL